MTGDAPAASAGPAAKGVEYLARLTGLLQDIAARQGDVIDTVSTRMAHIIQQQGLVHLYGSAHSMLPVLEIFPRYGSFVGLHPLVDPRLLWFNVLGSGGVPEMLYIQNTEGYARVFLDGQHVREGDMMIVFSHSGTSAVVIDTALYAKEKGLPVVAVMSRQTGAAAGARHSSGKKLLDLADYVLDTGVPRSEGLVEVEGLPEPVGAGSTIVATAIGLALVVSCADHLAANGYPVVQSVRAEANEHTAYTNVYDAYERSLRRS
ncbi:MAG TPA: sugar isomerase domain-containing protein [Chloroflexota bacterium]